MPERIQQPIPMKKLNRHFKPRGALKETQSRLSVASTSPPTANRRSRPGLNVSTAVTANHIGR